MLETLADGRQALRIEVRTNDEGVTSAALQIPDGQWLVLCTAPAPAYVASPEVQRALVELARAVVIQMLAEASVGVEETAVVPPGAPLDVAKH